MKKELKINLTYNTPSKEAIANFTEKAMMLYNEIIEREKEEQKEVV